MSSMKLTSPLAVAPSILTLFPQVVFGIDFGSASLAAARWATANVARGANAILSHVVSFPEQQSDDARSSLRADTLRDVMPELAGGLGGFAATLDLASVRSVLRIGRPSLCLSAIVNDAAASLVVLGRRGNANRKRIGEPNVIERLARRSSASVLVVPEGVSASPGHIVAAIDDGTAAPAVLGVARSLARLHRCPLTVIHVLSPAAGAYDRVIRSARHALNDGRDGDDERRATPPPALLKMTRWLVDLVRGQPEASEDRIEVLVGDPARQIVAAATGHGAPLLVVGQRGADEAPRGSLGSVTRELLTRAPMPVLAVSV